MPRVVLDTNVLVAAVRSRRGASFQLISRIGTGVFDIVVSVPLVLEYEAVLLRHAANLPLDEDDVRDLIDYICDVADQQEVFFLWRPLLRDAKDDHILEVAVAAGCEAVVTHNVRDFEGAQTFGISVRTPSQFVEEIRGK